MKKIRGIGLLCAAVVLCSACGDKNAIGGIESAESKKIFECQITLLSFLCQTHKTILYLFEGIRHPYV
ncbi:MAG: hypothetical protein K5669_09440 [Lachnospiraceae bacterium]|nr:hypothetical protein [Lachnospiraceae bacterium]